MDLLVQYGNYVVLILAAFMAYFYRRREPILEGIGAVIVIAVGLLVVVRVSVEMNKNSISETLLLQVLDRGTILLAALYGVLLGILIARVSMRVKSNNA